MADIPGNRIRASAHVGIALAYRRTGLAYQYARGPDSCISVAPLGFADVINDGCEASVFVVVVGLARVAGVFEAGDESYAS